MNLGEQYCDLPGRNPGDLARSMRECGPPYIFGSAYPIRIGDRFTVEGQPFAVVRMVTRNDFLLHHAHCIPAELAYCAQRSSFFFEAVTD